MKGSPKVLKSLNVVLTDVLTGINQTFLHARILRNEGLGELNETLYKESIRLMKVADRFINRILFLEGLPNLQELNRLKIGENPREILGSELKRSTGQVLVLRTAIAVAEEKNDYQTREVLENALGDEEDFVDWLETQHRLIESLGIENYLSEQLED